MNILNGKACQWWQAFFCSIIWYTNQYHQSHISKRKSHTTQNNLFFSILALIPQKKGYALNIGTWHTYFICFRNNECLSKNRQILLKTCYSFHPNCNHYEPHTQKNYHSDSINKHSNKQNKKHHVRLNHYFPRGLFTLTYTKNISKWAL